MQDDSFDTNAVSSVSPVVNASAVPEQTFEPESLSGPTSVVAGDSLLAQNAEDMLKKVGATDGEESLTGSNATSYEPARKQKGPTIVRPQT